MARSRRAAPAPAHKPATPAKAPAKQQAATAPAAPVQQQQQPSAGGGLLATVAEGMAFGTGSAIARHAVGAVADSFSSPDAKEAAVAAAAPVATAAPVQTPSPVQAICWADSKAFTDCLERRANDISACQFFLDALNQCKQQSVNL